MLNFEDDDKQPRVLSGVTVDLYVVLKAKQVRDGDNASITMELFEVRTFSDRTGK